jgi:hypothetical protein
MPDTVRGRRRFLNYLTATVLALLGLLVAVPAFGHLFAPLGRRRQDKGGAGELVDLGPVADLPTAEWSLRTVSVEQADAWQK